MELQNTVPRTSHDTHSNSVHTDIRSTANTSRVESSRVESSAEGYSPRQSESETVAPGGGVRAGGVLIVGSVV
jgi:hypothetical protein